jgi:hypothetical protein
VTAPSDMATRAVPPAVRWAMVGLVLGLGLWGALSWSLIPQAVDGRLDHIGYHSDTGYRFWVLELDGDRSLVVDRQVVNALGPAKMEGRTVTKDRWSTTLHVGDRTVPLRPSRAFWQVLVSLVALCFLGLRPWRARPSTGTDGLPPVGGSG